MKNLQEIYNEFEVDKFELKAEQSGKDEDKHEYLEWLCDISTPYFESKKYKLNRDDMETLKKYDMEDTFWKWRNEFLKDKIEKIEKMLNDLKKLI